nr:uncharacterized protein LOC131274176 [Dasypus novemcinctus]
MRVGKTKLHVQHRQFRISHPGFHHPRRQLQHSLKTEDLLAWKKPQPSWIQPQPRKDAALLHPQGREEIQKPRINSGCQARSPASRSPQAPPPAARRPPPAVTTPTPRTRRCLQTPPKRVAISEGVSHSGSNLRFAAPRDPVLHTRSPGIAPDVKVPAPGGPDPGLYAFGRVDAACRGFSCLNFTDRQHPPAICAGEAPTQEMRSRPSPPTRTPASSLEDSNGRPVPLGAPGSRVLWPGVLQTAPLPRVAPSSGPLQSPGPPSPPLVQPTPWGGPSPRLWGGDPHPFRDPVFPLRESRPTGRLGWLFPSPVPSGKCSSWAGDVGSLPVNVQDGVGEDRGCAAQGGGC